MDHMALGRHLLETQDVAMATEGLPLVAIVTGIVAIVAIVVLLALCTCQDKANSDDNPVQSINKTATPVLDQQVQQTTSVADSADVTVDVEGASSILRHSANGSAVRDSTESRPKSHDQRALPEIPATSAALASQTDEDDETDGHYDVISSSRNKRALAITPAKVVAPLAEDEISPIRTHPRPNRAHDYEAVDIDAESVSPYATGQEITFPMFGGVQEEEEEEDNSDRGGAYGIVKNPYAVVEGVGNADYAHIEERKDKRELNRDIDRLRGGLGSAPQASTETLDDESYSSVAAPPVPDKNFEEPGSNRRSANSPQLPPRNGGAAAQDGPIVGTVGLLGGSTADGAADADIVAISAAISAATENGGTSGKREPPYSRVTARESLAHLREREAQALMAATPVDATYESVDYDLVKTPSAGASSGQAGDRNSLTSDLYAEISMGENSTRSSVYARVDEVPSNPNAPTPPPVDILKTLSLPKEEETEMGDPGYSVIRRNRPHSTMAVSGPESRSSTHPVYAKVDWNKKQGRASVHVSENVQASGAGASGRVDFVINPYAEVKDKKDNSINPYSKIKSRNMNLRNGGTSRKVEDSYSEVKGGDTAKSKDVDPYAKDVDPYSKVKDVDPYSKVKDVDPYSKIKDTNPYADIASVVPSGADGDASNGGASNGHHTPEEYRGTGARPKIRENGATSPSNHSPENQAPTAPRKRFDPGYSTIGSVSKDPPTSGSAAETSDGTASAEVTQIVDPNYETFAMGTNGSAAAVSPPPNSPPPAYPAASLTPAYTNGTYGAASSGSPPSSPPLPAAPPARGAAREHIYQEISDARLEKDKLKKIKNADQSAASSVIVQSTAV